MKNQENQQYWFIFQDNKLLLEKDASGNFAVPYGETPPLPIAGGTHALAPLEGIPCFAAEAKAPLPKQEEPETYRLEAVDLRDAYSLIDKPLHDRAGAGTELLHFDKHSQFCPKCGSPNIHDNEHAKRCSGCGRLMFPNISMAILALVYKEDSILLVHAHNFCGPHHSCIAGFVEPGESLEECVRREVKEESNLIVDDIRYFDSQPWPFPSSLMAAFTARYTEGELRLQESELSSGAFYTRDNLPLLPPSFTLARRLIDFWLQQPAG